MFVFAVICFTLQRSKLRSSAFTSFSTEISRRQYRSSSTEENKCNNEQRVNLMNDSGFNTSNYDLSLKCCRAIKRSQPDCTDACSIQPGVKSCKVKASQQVCTDACSIQSDLKSCEVKASQQVCTDACSIQSDLKSCEVMVSQQVCTDACPIQSGLKSCEAMASQQVCTTCSIHPA